MKKIASLLLAALVCFAACQTKTNPNTDPDPVPVDKPDTSSTPEPLTFGIDPDTLRVPYEGGEFKVMMVSDSSWVAKKSEDWVYLNKYKNTTSMKLTVTVDPNPKAVERTACIIFTSGDLGFRYVIVQEGKPVKGHIKPILCWVDVHANYKRLGTEEKALALLDKVQEAGFNGIVLDVKPCDGQVLYDSKILPHLTSYEGVSRTYDYLNFFIDEIHRRGMTICISNTIMTFGNGVSKTGAMATNPELQQYACVEWTTEGFKNQWTDGTTSTVFLNPAYPEVRKLILDMITEEMELFGDKIDGFVLDYCRFLDLYSDFSEYSRAAFEQSVGYTVENFPEDILFFSSNGEPCGGKYYRDWIEWRAWIITNLIKDIRGVVKGHYPNLSFQLWAAAWWSSRYSVGQNWASPDVNFSKSYNWANPNYYLTGFANQLDVFQNGAYLSKMEPVYDGDSIPGALTTGRKLLNGNCKQYGTFSVANRKFPTKEAAYYCLANEDGVMVFDLCYMDNNNWWKAFKEGVDEAILDGTAYTED